MSVRSVILPGPVAMIPSPKALERLGRDLPDPVALAAEMNRLSLEHGLPSRIDQDKGPASLAVYTEQCVVWLRLTKGQDAYRITGAAPKGLKDHERLVKGAMLIRTRAGWWPLQDVSDVSPRGGVPANPHRMAFRSYWDLLVQAWNTVPDAASGEGLPDNHARYLDLLVSLIEASRDIEIAKQRTAGPMLYRHRGAGREERYNAKGVYEFTMVQTPRLDRTALLYLADRPEMRGRLVATKGHVVTIRFESTVDFQRIPPQGELRVLPSDRVHRAQLEAVELLRRGRSSNPHVLPVLVDNDFQPHRPDQRVTPSAPLDPRQLEAFRRALDVPDLSLIWGPPGTGKTRTISAIAAEYAARGRRVLITSHTNRAVDNVLKQLPAHVFSVRVGNEDLMTSHARGLRADVQVEALQKTILKDTEGNVSRLAGFSAGGDADRWMSYLDDNLKAALAGDAEVLAHRGARDRAAERVTEPLRGRIDAAQASVARLAATVASLRRRESRRQSQVNWLHAKGFMLAWLTGPLKVSGERLGRDLATAQTGLVQAQSELDTANGTARVLLAADPEVRLAETAMAAAGTSLGQTLARVDQAVQALTAVIATVQAAPSARPASVAEWEQLAGELRDIVNLQRRRAALLAEWRACIPRLGEELQREVVRYADVVAATCIGTATTQLLADLEFDVAIVDEAGQISLPILLVPLVRAKAAVLVGDHAQLPPYLDDDVKRWGETLPGGVGGAATEVVDLLTRSAFERLYDQVPADRRDMLQVQRRMPKELGDFVSRTFYRSALRTEHPGGMTDPLFRSPFAMISTADRPPAERAETRADRRNEDWNQYGYVNNLEATLITELITRYVAWYPDWTVIVAYRAQADLIRRSISVHLGAGSQVAERVGTVDSFQGGERDLIVYGFTRSNNGGDIGFLRELRRINVAISRAKSQLVLVGDDHTLERASDRAFADVMRSMTAYLRGIGDVRGSQEFQQTLRNLSGHRP